MPLNVVSTDPAGTNGMRTGGRMVLTPEGAVVQKKKQELAEKISAAVSQGKTEIILDFKKVTGLDSAALEMLTTFHDDLRGQGGTLKLVGLNSLCRDILIATRLVNVLFVYPDVHTAVTSRP